MWSIENTYNDDCGYEIVFNDDNVKRIISNSIRHACCSEQKWKCNMCGINLKYNNKSNWGGEIAHIDHIHPYSERHTYKNGINNINERNNLQALCPKCNLSKSKHKIN